MTDRWAALSRQSSCHNLLNAAVSGRQGERESAGKDRQIQWGTMTLCLRQKEQTGSPQAGFVGLHSVLKITEPPF